MNTSYVLLGILVVTVLGKANSVAVAAGILLLIKLAHAENTIFPALEKDGMFWGLVLLIASILIPIVKGEYNYFHIGKIFTNWVGITALLLSLLTTYLSGMGLRFLTIQQHNDIMLPLILGSVIAAAFMGGVPVGPLITSGLLALVVKIFNKS